MRTAKKIVVAIIAVVMIGVFFLYRNYNLKKLEERENITPPPSGSKQTTVCADEYVPVCGEDSNTYSNKCVAEEMNGVKVAYSGACKEKASETGTSSTASGNDIGENNLGDIESESGTQSTGSVETGQDTDSGAQKPPVETIESGPDYYKHLKAQCADDSCCISSAENMEAKGFKEATDGACPKGYVSNSLRCIGSYHWCEKSENTGSLAPSSTGSGALGATGMIDGKKTLNYYNSNFKYGFSLPFNSYYSGYGAQGGASHTVGISSGSGGGDLSSSEVRVYFYRGKVLPELEESKYGFYKDAKSGKTYMKIDGNSVMIEADPGKEAIVDMITKTLYAQ